MILGSISITYSKTDEGELVMNWLSLPEPNSRHQGVRADLFDCVRHLFLKRSQFREYKGSKSRVDKAVMFCSGILDSEDKFGVKGGTL